VGKTLWKSHNVSLNGFFWGKHHPVPAVWSMSAISVLVQVPIDRVQAAFAFLHSLMYIPSSQHPEKHISIFHAFFYDFISKENLS